MYRILGYDTPDYIDGHVVYDPVFGAHILDGKLTLKENEIDSLTLTVDQENWLYGNTGTFLTHVSVYQDDLLIFRGRLLDITREMKDNGEFNQTFVFESIANYLKDSIQRFKKVQNTTPEQFFRNLIDFHNSQVPDYKKFVVGKVEVTNSTDNVYRYVDYVDTWTTIKDKLLSRLGGIVTVVYSKGVNYINYLSYNDSKRTHVYDNNIVIGTNMKSLSNQEDPTEVITRLVPLGATIQDDTENADTDAASPRTTIASVNGGVDYIDIPDLQEQFGIINGTHTWDDVHQPNILLTKAKQFIAKQASVKNSYTIAAVELPNYDDFLVSNSYLVINDRVMVAKQLRVIQKEIDFNSPYSSTLTVGDRAFSLSRYQLETANAQKQALAIKDRELANRSDLSSLKIDMDNQIFELQKRIKNTSSAWQGGVMFASLDDTHVNKTADWYKKLFNAGVNGAVIKLTKGSATINAGFDTENTAISNANIKLVGVFHTLEATDAMSATVEGQHFLSQIQTKGLSTSIITALYIGESVLSQDAALLTACITAFNKVLTDAGYMNTVDYAYSDWFDNRFTSQASYRWVIDTSVSSVPNNASAWQFNNHFNNESLQVSKSYNRAFI